jgi:uncharacterized protein (DUF1800 family)
MKNLLWGALLCTASTLAATQPKPETFVIHTGESGRIATIMIPAGAVSNFSADAAEALTGSDPRIESMRLSGDVRIQVIGQAQPIEITADKVVLELTADEKRATTRLESHHAGNAILWRSSETVLGGRDDQIFTGNVAFTVDTVAGAMRIRADRVEHRPGAAGA